MTTIKVTEILDYYDGPRVVLAQDAHGRPYLADFIAADGEPEQYQVVPAPDALLAQLRIGEVDLRSFLLEAGANEWYLTDPTRTMEPELALTRQESPIARSEWLPPPGYTIEDDDCDWEAVVFGDGTPSSAGTAEPVAASG